MAEEQFDVESSPQIQSMAALAKTLPKKIQKEFDNFLQILAQGLSVSATVTGAKHISDEVQKTFFERLDAFIMRYSDVIYARPLHEGHPVQGALTYDMLELQDFEKVVTAIYKEKTRTVDGQQIKNIMDSLRKAIRLEREEVQLDNSVIEITPSLFWDGKDGSFSEEPKGLCSRRLFNTSMEGKNVVKYPPHAFNEYADKIRRYVDVTTQELEESDGDLHEDPRLSFISTWADGDHETYMDIIRMFASNFMEPKPFGIYMLIGEGRNGKSQICDFVKIMSYHLNNSTGKREWQYINHGDLQAGDYVLSWEGKPTKVTHLWPEKSRPCYRITLSDGRTVECSDTHEWAVVPEHCLSGHRPRVRDVHGRPTDERYTVPIKRYEPDMWEIMSTKEIMEDYKAPDISKEGWKRVNAKYYIPPAHPVTLPEQDLPIDPYVLGIIIGDAHITPKGDVRISGMDPELIEAVTGRPALIEEKKTAKSKAGITNYSGTTAHYKDDLLSFGLTGKRSYEKFIPPIYLIGSIEQRYALLRGLLDTDGYISHGKVNSKNNQVEFSTTSKQLADQVRSLVFSLGGSATIHERMGKYKLPDGSYKTTRPNYRLFIRTLENPFRLPRKASCWRPQKWLGYTAITNIEYIGDLPCQCITVDDPYHLYQVTENYVPTHNCCIGLIHTIFGTKNTTQIQIKQLGEWHYNLEFANTLVNAPDEEENKLIEDQALFKSLSDHGEVRLARMARQDALSVRGDFMMIVPMNHTPKWPKDGAEACIRRTRIIAFNADLSSEDAKPINFAKETFTPERVSFLIGTAMGVARYYLSHPFPDSKAMVKEREALEEEMVSGKVYRERLQKYFNGYKIREMEKDYELWCEVKNLPKQPARSFKRLFQRYEAKGETTFSVSSSKTKKGYRMSPGKNLLYKDFVLPEFNNTTVKQCHDRGWSVVAMLDGLYEEEM